MDILGPRRALTVSTVSSNRGACRSAACQLKQKRRKAFEQSVRASSLQFAVLGNSSSWHSWLWMSTQYEMHAAAVAAQHPEHLVVAIDSSDGLVQADGEEGILAAYRQVVSQSPMGQPLVMALETGCVSGFCVRIPSLPTPSRVPGNFHVNGGFVMGPARLMQQLWHAVAFTNVSCCHKGRMHPQLGMGKFALLHPELVVFDTHQRLAAVINLHDPTEWTRHYHATNGFITNRHTQIKPAFLHFPGQQFPTSWSAYRDQVLGPRGLL